MCNCLRLLCFTVFLVLRANANHSWFCKTFGLPCSSISWYHEHRAYVRRIFSSTDEYKSRRIRCPGLSLIYVFHTFGGHVSNAEHNRDRVITQKSDDKSIFTESRENKNTFSWFDKNSILFFGIALNLDVLHTSNWVLFRFLTPHPIFQLLF